MCMCIAIYFIFLGGMAFGVHPFYRIHPYFLSCLFLTQSSCLSFTLSFFTPRFTLTLTLTEIELQVDARLEKGSVVTGDGVEHDGRILERDTRATVCAPPHYIAARKI